MAIRGVEEVAIVKWHLKAVPKVCPSPCPNNVLIDGILQLSKHNCPIGTAKNAFVRRPLYMKQVNAIDKSITLLVINKGTRWGFPYYSAASIVSKYHNRESQTGFYCTDFPAGQIPFVSCCQIFAVEFFNLTNLEPLIGQKLAFNGWFHPIFCECCYPALKGMVLISKGQDR